jgi:transcriptional regulator with XRE-family HTH domain
MTADLVFVKDVIRTRRKVLGLNQTDLARAVGLQSAEHISLIEAGRRSVPPEKAPTIAAAIAVDRMTFCKLVLFERYPQLYAALFGAERPSAPKVLNS